MNYKTYAEAKIAHPDSEIVTTTKLHSNGPEFEFLPVKFIDGYYRSQCDLKKPNVEDGIWVICNPADHCSSIKEFLEAGFKFSSGDLFTSIDGCLGEISGRSAKENEIKSNDGKRYILSSAALNGGCKIPAKSEQWTVYSNTLPLCDLTDEQYGKMRRMHDAGAAVEFANVTNGFEFEVIDNPKWCKDQVYRIKPKSERELFIEAAMSVGGLRARDGAEDVYGGLFDSGKFKYIDKTQFFGESI